MKTSLLSASLLTLAMTVPVMAENAVADRTTSLKPAPLPIDSQALSPTSVPLIPEMIINGVPTPAGVRMRLKGKTGTVMPKGYFVIRKGAAVSAATILDNTLNFSSPEPGVISLAKDNGKAVRLKESGAGFENIPLVLPNKKPALVALPCTEAWGEGLHVHFCSNMIMTGRIEGEEVCFFDDNIDGLYSVGKDAFSVGSGVVFAPLGTWLPTAKGLFKLSQISDDGSKISYAPCKDAVGKLDLKFVNPLAEAHVVYSDKGIDAVLVSGRKPVVTLSGTYQLSYGLVLNPQSKITFAGIIPHKLPALELATDKTAIATLGAPFTLDFKATAEKRTVKIPADFDLFGKSKEEYICYRWTSPPNVWVNDKKIGNFEYG